MDEIDYKDDEKMSDLSEVSDNDTNSYREKDNGQEKKITDITDKSDKKDITDKTDNGQDIQDTTFLNYFLNNKLSYSINQQIAIYLYHTPNSTILDLQEKTGKEYDTVQKTIKRDEGNLFRVCGHTGKQQSFALTAKGTRSVESIIKQWQDERDEEARQQQLKHKLESDAQKQIEMWIQYFDANPKLVSEAESGSLVIDLKSSSLTPELAELAIDKPIDTKRFIQLALQQCDIATAADDVQILYRGGDSFKIGSDLGINSLGKLKQWRCQVKSTSKLQLTSVWIIFECPQCASSTPQITQSGDIVKKPTRCTKCGYKGSNFKILDQRCQNIQHMTVEEAYDELGDRTNTRAMKCILRGALCDSRFDRQKNPGSRVKLSGRFLEEIQLNSQGSRKTAMNYVFEVSYLQSDEDLLSFQPTPEEKARFEELAAKEPSLGYLYSSVAPHIAGARMLLAKKAIIHLCASTSCKSSIKRSHIHALLVGDKSTGKSQIVKSQVKLIPRGRFAQGATVSTVGLLGSVLKDENTGQWMLGAGSLALADGSVLAIDEGQNLDAADWEKLNSALEEGFVSIDKAGMQGVMQSNTAVIAVMNPKNSSHFEQDEDFISQISMRPNTLSRFDLIVAVPAATEDKDWDDIAEGILGNATTAVGTLSPQDMAKYLAYAQTFNPEMTSEATARLKEIFLNLRKLNPEHITARHMESVIRIARTFARLRFRHEIQPKDCADASELFIACLESLKLVGRDAASTFIAGIDTSANKRMKLVLEAMKAIAAEQDEGIIHIDDLKSHSILEKLTRQEIDSTIKTLCHENKVERQGNNVWIKSRGAQ